MTTSKNTVVVGGGQAGLSVSHYLVQHAVEHVVLEQANGPGDAWRNHRWAGFDQVPRDQQAVEHLDDPQATYPTDLVGPDATALVLAPLPAFASRKMAAEMTYWLALMRDVPGAHRC